MADLSSLSFRPAGLGGFNKKDVIAYVKALSDKHASEVKSLERALSESVKQKDMLSEKLASAKAECVALKYAFGDIDSLREALDSSENEVSSLKEKLAECEKALEKASSDAAALKEENAALKVEKEKSDEVLSRLEKEKQAVTELELEARIRARDSEESARSRIASIISTYQTEFAEAKDSFRHYKTSADRLITSTEDQLKDMLTLFGELESELELSEKAFEKLSADPAEK